MIIKRAISAQAVVVVLAGVLVAGCGSPHEASVSGTVTLDGEPLDRGTVSFHPVGEGAVAYGQIGADGSYEVKTGRESGLAPGDYKVTVVATTPPPPPKDPMDEPVGELITPQRYGAKQTTDLQFAVEPGSNTIDLELTSSS